MNSSEENNFNDNDSFKVFVNTLKILFWNVEGMTNIPIESSVLNAADIL